MFYKQFLFILASLLLVPALFNGAKVQANSCEEIVEGHGLELSVTDGLWAFIEELLQRQDLRLAHLERMLEELKENRLVNIYTPQETQINSSKLIYSQTAAEYFASSQLDLKKLKYRLEQKIAELKQNQDERTQVKEQTASPCRKIKFVELGVPGKFVMGGEQNALHETVITYSVAFTDTHITQNQWVAETKTNPSLFSGKDEIEGVIQHPDHPMKRITWYAAAWYANQLSKKMGLPETYDFSEFRADSTTSASDGSLKPTIGSGEVLIYESNIYEAPGVRLATEAELEWLALAPVNDGKKTKTKYPWGNDLKRAEEFCWYRENSNAQTHEVASKSPYLIRGQQVFDLAGNVKSWSNDKINELATPYFEKVNPVGPSFGYSKVVRGGAFNLDERYLHASYRDSTHPDFLRNANGLRLVRTCF